MDNSLLNGIDHNIHCYIYISYRLQFPGAFCLPADSGGQIYRFTITLYVEAVLQPNSELSTNT